MTAAMTQYRTGNRRQLIPIAGATILFAGILLALAPFLNSDPYVPVDLKALGWFDLDQTYGTLDLRASPGRCPECGNSASRD
jgi:hypothetical protein